MMGQGLTQEMIDRIERNRAAALEKRKRFEISSVFCGPEVKSIANSQSGAESSLKIQRFSPGIGLSESHLQSVEFIKKNSEPPKLSSEQELVWLEVMGGKSIFLTGCGGTGKSFLTNLLIDALKAKFGKISVAVTASTGIAACQLGGTSLHNFAGIGLGNGTADELIERVSRNKKVCQRWKKTRCLVIDEVSMLDGELFDKLEVLARNIRSDDRPFGGIQLLLVGDFLQLPPVNKSGAVQFCFEGRAWRKVIELHVELKQVFRQRNAEFVEMLNSIRQGICSKPILDKLQETRANRLNEGNGIHATRLFATNSDVDRINDEKLHQLPGEIVCLVSEDSGESPYMEMLDKNCLAPQRLLIKPGAQVMLLKNVDIEGGLTNGTRGVIDAMVEVEEQGSVQLSPRVIFETKDGTLTRLVRKEIFSLESFGKVVASRNQFPLRLAYAITIHKCQGMTLSKVELSLASAFECGQAYVALSRVSDLSGLRLLDFNPSVVKAHPRVLEFYRCMHEIGTSERSNPRKGSCLPRMTTASPLPHAQQSGEPRKNPLFSYDD